VYRHLLEFGMINQGVKFSEVRTTLLRSVRVLNADAEAAVENDVRGPMDHDYPDEMPLRMLDALNDLAEHDISEDSHRGEAPRSIVPQLALTDLAEHHISQDSHRGEHPRSIVPQLALTDVADHHISQDSHRGSDPRSIVPQQALTPQDRGTYVL
jgi:hypothetical protein